MVRINNCSRLSGFHGFFFLLDKSNKTSEFNTFAQITPPNSIQMRHSHSFSSTLNTLTQSLTSIFDRVWLVIELYRIDPHPEVASLASIIYNDNNYTFFHFIYHNHNNNIINVFFFISFHLVIIIIIIIE